MQCSPTQPPVSGQKKITEQTISVRITNRCPRAYFSSPDWRNVSNLVSERSYGKKYRKKSYSGSTNLIYIKSHRPVFSHLASADILINHEHNVMTSSPYHENLQSIPVRITNRNYNKSQITPSTTYRNLITVPSKTQNMDKKSFVPKILLTNTMSLTLILLVSLKHGFKDQLTNRVFILLDTILVLKTVAEAVTVVSVYTLRIQYLSIALTISSIPC